MWRRIDLMWTDVSEERITSIFKVKKSASEEPAWANQNQLCKIWGFHGGDYEECRILGCGAV
jgi:hypothetical protein